jgi:hypothetical protein
VPVPPQSSYLSALSRALGRYLAELIRRGGEALRLGPEVRAGIAAALVVLAVAALAWVLVALLRRRRQTAVVREAGAAASAPAPSNIWDAEAWRAELERLFSIGSEGWSEARTGEALRAAWWWLARSIAGPEAAADWTSRDLAARVRKRELRDAELRDALRRLDALTFGAGRPGLADLRGLAEQIRGALG